jgi:biotin operon repressor
MKVNEEQILKALSLNKDWISGEALSQTFQISRAAVFKRLQNLIKQSYPIEISRSGYRLKYQDEPVHLNTTAAPFYYYPSTDSTMLRAREFAQTGAEHGTIIFASQQTQGKTNSSKSWISPAGGLYFTILLRWELSTAWAGAISLEILTQLKKILNKSTEKQSKLETIWPHHLLLSGGKLAGLLLETHGPCETPDYWLAGIGLNIHESQELLSLKTPWSNCNLVSRVSILEQFQNWAISSKGPQFNPDSWIEKTTDVNQTFLIHPQFGNDYITDFQGYNGYGDFITSNGTIRYGTAHIMTGVNR